MSSTPRERIRGLIEKYGTNSNHFLSLYDGFRYFEARDGAVAYFEVPHAWVAAGEPLASPESQARVLDEFIAAAAATGRGVACIPVSAEFARQCEQKGYRSIMVGSEPLFRLDRYPKSGQTWVGVVPTAKQLHTRGARVREVNMASLSPEKRAELDAVTAEWLRSRKMAALSFLNKVEPWTLSHDKKFFELVYNGRVSAFVAAIPVWPRKGWYLVDLMRRSDTEAGTTELLILESMRLLKEQGAREVTLGVAPLANLENAPSSQPAWLNQILRKTYEGGGYLYNFKSLHQYKLKFEPNGVENAFIVFASPAVRPLVLLGVLRAFVPNGLVAAGLSGVARAIGRFSLSDWLRGQVQPGLVVRSAPPSLARLVFRCRMTLIFVLSWLVLGAVVLARGHGRLAEAIEAGYSFSWSALTTRPLSAVAAPWILHWNVWHLLSNTVLGLIFCGALEFLAGSGLTTLVFSVGALAANPLTAALVLLPAGQLAPERFAGLATETDVGASLAIMACAGGLSSILRRGHWLAAALLVASLTEAAVTHSGLALNHVVALALGWAVARLVLRN